MQPVDRLIWLRARRCDAGTCVEVAHYGVQVLVRDSKDPDRVLTFDRQEWAAFLDGVYSGDFVGVPGAQAARRRHGPLRGRQLRTRRDHRQSAALVPSSPLPRRMRALPQRLHHPQLGGRVGHRTGPHLRRPSCLTAS